MSSLTHFHLKSAVVLHLTNIQQSRKSMQTLSSLNILEAKMVATISPGQTLVVML